MTDLVVPFNEKDEVKRLGARWDGDRRTWYIPAGIDPARFAKWLPGTPAAPVPAVEGGAEGCSLADYMAQVAAAMNRAVPPPVWIRCELSEFKDKNTYSIFSLVEYASDGSLAAKAQAFMRGQDVDRALRALKEAGVRLEPGVKLMLKAKAEMHPSYGFRLIATEIDPKFTLGDMAAKLAMIRTVLTAEGIFDKQLKLPAPPDFLNVAVVSPEAAAGLGDFMSSARGLESWGLCHFELFTATFQGEKAVPELLAVLAELHGMIELGDAFDAVVIIRGGGAVTDLAWLNDLDLARAVATFPVPVITGIGHEKDNTILDEVAYRKFDTPSKVINAIAARVQTNALDAIEHMLAVVKDSQRLLVTRSGEVSNLMLQVRAAAEKRTASASEEVAGMIRDVRQLCDRLLERQGQEIEALAREVLGLSPMNTVERGYALVRGADGRVISSCGEAAQHNRLRVQLRDGDLEVKPTGE